jgi:hypothetical protein
MVMDNKKKIAIGAGVLGGVVLLCGCGCGGFYFFLTSATKPPVDATDRFLALLGQGKTSEAHASAATMLRNRQSVDDFDAEMKQLGLNDYASSSFPIRKVENETATIEGTVKTKKGGSIPLTVKLNKEDGTWRVSSVTSPDSVASTKPPKSTETKRPDTKTKPPDTKEEVKPPPEEKPMAGKVPGPMALRKMTDAALQDFAQKFKGKGFNFDAVKDVAPVFDPAPMVGADGRLVLKGHIPGKGTKATFELKYQFDNTDWRLTESNMQFDSTQNQ